MKRSWMFALALVVALSAGCAVKEPALVAPPVPTEAAGVIKTGPVAIDRTAMEALQQQVDNGHQPWRLDPIQVVMEEGQKYGFQPGSDRFRMVSQAGTEAVVEAQHGSVAYLVTLVQPNGARTGSIWTISAIEKKP